MDTSANALLERVMALERADYSEEQHLRLLEMAVSQLENVVLPQALSQTAPQPQTTADQ